MPVTPTYPGVYIEEIPSGVRTITGVSTSIGAFVDYFSRGRVNKATRIFSQADFDREFGGLDTKSEASYAVQQFFLNGGREAYVVRVAGAGAAKADAQIGATIGAGSNALVVTAVSEGAWGGSLRCKVDTLGCASGEFNLIVTEASTTGGRTSIVRQEVFRNLSMTSTQPNFADKIVNDELSGSKLVRVAASGSAIPLPNSTMSGLHTAVPTIPASPGDRTLAVTVTDGTATETANTPQLTFPSLAGMTTAQALNAIAPVVESGIRAASPASAAFSGATVVSTGAQLVIVPGGSTSRNRISFGNTPLGADTSLKLITAAAPNGVTVNSQEYVLGGGAIANTAQRGGATGIDGSAPGSAELIGDLNTKSGIFALEDADLFNILCIPRTAQVSGDNPLTPTQASAVITVAESYCEKRRAFFVLDTPSNITDQQGIAAWLAANGTLRNKNAALYFPRVKVPDPLANFRLRSIGASGTVAGIYARTDGERGVWKAPAGTEAVTRNVPELDDILSDGENGALNPLAINCLRFFPAFGNVVWGARTLEGSDQLASEWKYVPVRRIALFLEESLYRGLQWVVFEPNDEPLWAQIRLNVGAFMQNLFRQGAFQGKTPREAYFVKCDAETTTQNDINLGIVNIIVGFAPLKPAEFVIVKIQQMAGQIQS